jgi:hypothetical protein
LSALVRASTCWWVSHVRARKITSDMSVPARKMKKAFLFATYGTPFSLLVVIDDT